MGYTSKDIAVITEPKQVTLSASPNFVQFASKPATKTYLELNIEIRIKASTNLLNPNTITDGYYIAPTGILTALAGYGVSDYIPVEPNTQYTGYNGYTNAFRTYAFYDADQNFISQQQNASNTFTTTATTAYVRVSLYGPTHGSSPRPYNQQGVFKGVSPIFEPWTGSTPSNISALTRLVITAPDGTVHNFNGTTDREAVGGNVFYVSTDTSDTAENLRQALLADPWLNANFEIIIPFVWQGGNVSNGNVINIKSKGAGDDYEFTLTAPNNASNSAYLITWVSTTSTNNDSISGEASTAEIDVDVYIDPDVFLGQDDRPINAAKIGTYLTTLSKTYAGTPVWFELNALFNQYPGYNLPTGLSGWFNTGTISIYRFVAKVKAINSFAFYQSNALYVVNGYGRVSDTLDLQDYVYEAGSVKLLTNKPKTPYVIGQREYLNFIFKDTQRDVSEPIDFSLQIVYRAYSTAGDYLGTIYDHQKARATFNIVNTCVLNIDQVLNDYPTAGLVKVALARGTAIVSNDLEYEIRPDCLHELNAFTFLNRLGGWDAFNFDAETQDEIKPENETYNKTLTPAFTKGDSLETVYATTLNNTLTIEGAPVSNEVAEWLKELAAARTILDKDGNYLIIEDFTLKQTGATSNQHVPTIKYRLSENYTNG